MSAYIGLQDSPYEGELPNVEEEYDENSGIPEYKITRGFVRDRGMQTSSDNEDSFDDMSSEPGGKPTDETYERRRHRHVASSAHPAKQVLGHGMNAAEDAASCAVTVAGAALRGVMGKAKMFWEMTAKELAPPPLPISRPPVRRYKTAQGAFHEVRGLKEKQQERVILTRSDEPPPPQPPMGISGPYGRARKNVTITSHPESSDDEDDHHAPGYRHRQRFALRGAGGLIEVSDDDNEDDYAEARDREYLTVDIRGRKSVIIREATRPQNPSPPPLSNSDIYSQPEGEDSDFDKGGGVSWPLDKETKRKHMAKMAARREAEAEAMRKKKEDQDIQDAERKKREDARERRAKALIKKIRQEEAEQPRIQVDENLRMTRELEEWPDAHNAMIGRPSQESDEGEPSTEEGKFAKYAREKAEAREVGAKRMSLRRQSEAERPRGYEGRDSLLNPIKGLGLSAQTRKGAQELFSKDRQVRKAEAGIIHNVQPIVKALLKK